MDGSDAMNIDTSNALPSAIKMIHDDTLLSIVKCRIIPTGVLLLMVECIAFENAEHLTRQHVLREQCLRREMDEKQSEKFLHC